MTFSAITGPVFVAGATGALGSLTCLLVLGKVILGKFRASARRSHADLRAELETIMSEHRVECSEQIARLGDSIAVPEPTGPNVDGAPKGGLTRSLRRQAIQMLQSGMPPEKAASILGIARREMRLIAGVSDTISIKQFNH